MTVLAALLLVGCTAVTDGYEEELVPEVSHSYVNLTIAVANNGAITRGTPLGGEEGNGREAGFNPCTLSYTTCHPPIIQKCS